MKSQKGQGLVETLMAVAVAVIVVTSLVSLAIFALRNSKQSSYASQATQIAETQLQYLRSYRDNSLTPWADFISPATGGTPNCTGTLPACGSAPASTFCHSSDVGAPIANVATSTPFTFYYSLNCIPSGSCTSTGGLVRASVLVTWSVGGRTECVYNNTDFTNWRSK